MTKKEIVMKIADEKDLKQVEVGEIIQSFMDAIVESLARGEDVELRNFGMFRVKTRKARTGRNPRTGEDIAIPAKKAVSFKPGLSMKEKLG
jgi:nucleoid DNA-binding protein